MSSSHCLGLTTAWKITRILLTKMMRRMRRIHGSRGWAPSLGNLWGLWPAPDQWHEEWSMGMDAMVQSILHNYLSEPFCRWPKRHSQWLNGKWINTDNHALEGGKNSSFWLLRVIYAEDFAAHALRFWQVELEEFRSTLCRTVQLYFCFKTKIYKEKIPHKRQQHLSVGSFVSNELNSHVTLHLARGLLALCCSLQSKVKDS